MQEVPAKEELEAKKQQVQSLEKDMLQKNEIATSLRAQKLEKESNFKEKAKGILGDYEEDSLEKILGEKKALLEKFRLLLLEYNQKYNLTAILEEKDIYYKHFLDSAAGVDLFSENAKVAEIGSGAGFPSIVLKILRPDLQFDLFESVGKKCEFLKAVVDNFGFTGVNIYNVRAEDAAKDMKFRTSESCLLFLK